MRASRMFCMNVALGNLGVLVGAPRIFGLARA
jgi:hypothetical protein